LYIGSVILGAVLVSMFAFGRYELTLEDRIGQINDQIVVLEQSRNKNEEKNLRLVKERIVLTSRLLNDHIHWTKAFDSVTGLLQNGIRFKSFTGDTATSKININVQATNYTVLAKQAAAFLTEANLSDFSLSKIAPLTSGILETSFDFSFSKEQFLKDKK